MLRRRIEARTLDRMLDEDVMRLSEPYPPALQAPDLAPLRLAGALGLNLAEPTRLGDEIFADLDDTIHGIGWWKAYGNVDLQTRILLSDYLVACARAVLENLIEAEVERLELDHAVEDFRQWMSRLSDRDQPTAAGAPRSAYEELSSHRVRTHLAGALRAWGSALDCVGGCIIGVTGVPSNLIKASLSSAMADLAKQSPGCQALEEAHLDLARAEANAGPPGWRDWLLGMRNTYVHRGRRTITWNAESGGNEVTGFSVCLPIQPDLTEVDAVVHAQGLLAANFTVPSADMVAKLAETVGTYTTEACGILTELWRRRRVNPDFLAQSPLQWRQPPGLIRPPAFRGFPDLAEPATQFSSIVVSPEGERRLRSAGLLHDAGADRRPEPGVWHWNADGLPAKP